MDADALSSFTRRMSMLRAELNRQVANQSVDTVAGAAGLEPAELAALLDGADDGDTFMIARLEAYFGVRLWPPLEETRGHSAGDEFLGDPRPSERLRPAPAAAKSQPTERRRQQIGGGDDPQHPNTTRTNSRRDD
jgi:hypothetical protein